MKPIRQLTPEQESRLSAHGNKWVDSTLSTHALNRTRVEEILQALYQEQGWAHPRVVWCGSPHDPQMQHAMADPASRMPMETVRDSLQRELKNLVRHAIHRSARFKIQDTLARQVHLSIGHVVAEGIPCDWLDGLTRYLWLPDLDDPPLLNALGPHDAIWLSTGDFMAHGLQLFQPPPRMLRLTALQRLIGWAVLQKDVCWVSERPQECHQIQEASGRLQLHRSDGPAMQYRNGDATWWIRGVRVNEQIVIRPETLLPRNIQAERNAEVRRVMIDRFGRDRYLRESGARLIDECPTDHPIKGLRTAKLWATGDDIWLDLLTSTSKSDGSSKRHVLPIDGSVYGGRAGRECLAAVASTWRKRFDSSKAAFLRPEHYSPANEA